MRPRLVKVEKVHRSSLSSARLQQGCEKERDEYSSPVSSSWRTRRRSPLHFFHLASLSPTTLLHPIAPSCGRRPSSDIYVRTNRHRFVQFEKKRDTPTLPESGDETAERRALRLAFGALKCTPESH